jgi:F-type H+-transporting ATPase subunit delta
MSIFAARYARAFADVTAQFHLETASVDKQLTDFLASWDDSAMLREVFEDPSVPVTQKIAVVDQMKAQLKLDPQVRNLLAVLVEHDRIGAVHDVVDEYRKELQLRLGVHQAEITTARKLSPEDRATLVEQVGKLAKGQVNASFRQDESILGGVVVRIGSTVYDGSVLGRFQRLREQLSQ